MPSIQHLARSVFDDDHHGFEKSHIPFIIVPLVFVLITTSCILFLAVRARRMRRAQASNVTYYPQPVYQRVYYSNNGYGYANLGGESQPDLVQPQAPPRVHLSPEPEKSPSPPSYGATTAVKLDDEARNAKAQ